MATKKKMLQAAAGNATGGAGLDITDVFSTYLYTGNGSTQTITNGIDLAGEGGLVWIKTRGTDTNFSHLLQDTERGAGNVLASNTTDANIFNSGFITSFSSDGFSVGSIQTINKSGNDLASWTFRKAPKFFDVVTYTGTGSPQTIAHNLGSVPGCIITKVTDDATGWAVYHRGNTSAPETERLILEENYATSDDNTYWNDTAPTSTHFTVGTTPRTNSNGKNIVAYLFAHNDGDGEFGPDGDQDIIKCGSYTGTGAAGNFIDLGFEPQWVLVKVSSSSDPWVMEDTMRGIPVGGTPSVLYANSTNAEFNGAFAAIDLQADGFSLRGTDNTVNAAGQTYIYIAIRRGPLAPPESGTEVFAMDTSTSDTSSPFVFSTGFVADGYMYGRRTGNGFGLQPRLTNGRLLPYSTSSEASLDGFVYWDSNTSVTRDALLGNASTVDYAWKRAPGFFDVVAYTGTGGDFDAKDHNLKAVPELIIIKNRTSATDWPVWTTGFVTGNGPSGTSEYLLLNSSAAKASSTGSNLPFGADPTESTFTVGSWSRVNDTGNNYIAYLFATLAGVSKVGSYTGDGTGNRVIDCGFTSGARFILIKRTDGTGNWSVWDTERGILAGDVDARLELNTTDAEENSSNHIDPDPSGFKIISNFNTSGQEYIFYAIA